MERVCHMKFLQALTSCMTERLILTICTKKITCKHCNHNCRKPHYSQYLQKGPCLCVDHTCCKQINSVKTQGVFFPGSLGKCLFQSKVKQTLLDLISQSDSIHKRQVDVCYFSQNYIDLKQLKSKNIGILYQNHEIRESMRIITNLI